MNRRPFCIVEAPSILGLGVPGVGRLPDSLLEAGLSSLLGARVAGRVAPPAFSAVRDPESGILNASAIRTYSGQLADALGPLLDAGEFPVVLGGDCSILLGSMLALRKRGRYGLLFLDGHMDFYSPETSPTGEAADMDLALVTGRGPAIVTVIEGFHPLVLDEDTVAIGYRDAEAAAKDGAPSLKATKMHCFDLQTLLAEGAETVARKAASVLASGSTEGFFIHLDVDVFDDSLVPAVDYRMPHGLQFEDVQVIVAAALRTGMAVGIEVTIFNPDLDPTRTVSQRLTNCLVQSLRG